MAEEPVPFAPAALLPRVASLASTASTASFQFHDCSDGIADGLLPSHPSDINFADGIDISEVAHERGGDDDGRALTDVDRTHARASSALLGGYDSKMEPGPADAGVADAAAGSNSSPASSSSLTTSDGWDRREPSALPTAEAAAAVEVVLVEGECEKDDLDGGALPPLLRLLACALDEEHRADDRGGGVHGAARWRRARGSGGGGFDSRGHLELDIAGGGCWGGETADGEWLEENEPRDSDGASSSASLGLVMPCYGEWDMGASHGGARRAVVAGSSDGTAARALARRVRRRLEDDAARGGGGEGEFLHGALGSALEAPAAAAGARGEGGRAHAVALRKLQDEILLAVGGSAARDTDGLCRGGGDANAPARLARIGEDCARRDAAARDFTRAWRAALAPAAGCDGGGGATAPGPAASAPSSTPSSTPERSWWWARRDDAEDFVAPVARAAGGRRQSRRRLDNAPVDFGALVATHAPAQFCGASATGAVAPPYRF